MRTKLKLTPQITHSHPQRNPNFFNSKVCSSTIIHRQMAPRIQFIHKAQLKFNKSILKFKLYFRNKFAKHKSQISWDLLKCKYCWKSERYDNIFNVFVCVCVSVCFDVYIFTSRPKVVVVGRQGTVLTLPHGFFFLRKGLFVRFCLSAFWIL